VGGARHRRGTLGQNTPAHKTPLPDPDRAHSGTRSRLTSPKPDPTHPPAHTSAETYPCLTQVHRHRRGGPPPPPRPPHRHRPLLGPPKRGSGWKRCRRLRGGAVILILCRMAIVIGVLLADACHPRAVTCESASDPVSEANAGSPAGRARSPPHTTAMPAPSRRHRPIRPRPQCMPIHPRDQSGEPDVELPPAPGTRACCPSTWSSAVRR